MALQELSASCRALLHGLAIREAFSCSCGVQSLMGSDVCSALQVHPCPLSSVNLAPSNLASWGWDLCLNFS